MVDMGYQFRIYPNQAQRQLIERTFGCTRWVWNHFLNTSVRSNTRRPAEARARSSR